MIGAIEASWSDRNKRITVTNSRGTSPAAKTFVNDTPFAEHNLVPTSFYRTGFFESRIGFRTIFIQDLGDQRVRLLEPLAISIESTAARAIACQIDLGEFAYADTEIEAIDELKALICDLYFLLQREEENLGPLPQKHWHFLKSIIQEA